MKISFKMIRVGLTATLCAGLLAACDNRSVTPFKSKTWTKEELAFNKALQDGKAPNAPTSTDGAISNSGGGQAALPDGESPLVTPKPLPQPGKEDSKVDTGSAQSKFGVEFAKREKEQQKTSKIDLLTSLFEKSIATIDADLAKQITSISIKVERSASADAVSVKASLNLNGQQAYLLVDQATLAAAIDGDIAPLAAELHVDKNFQDQAQAIGNSVYVWAFHPKNMRDTVYLLLDVRQPDNKRKYALFTVQMENGKSSIIASNMGNVQDIKPFEAAKVEEKSEDKGADGQAGEGTIAKSDKSEVDKGEMKSQNPADAGAAGTDAQSSGKAEDKGATPAPATPEKQGAAKPVNADTIGRAVVDTKGDRLMGAAPDVTKRGVPSTRVNLAELSANKNTPVKFAIPQKDQANTKSIMYTAPSANSAVAKAAPAARIDVTQVVKSKASLTMNGVDVYARNKALAAQTQVAAAKPVGKPSLSINGQAMLTNTATSTAATTPASTSATTSTASASTTTPSANQGLRARTKKAVEQREAARKANEAKAVVKSAEAN